MKLKTVTQTCGACPSQWSGKMENGNELYVRYRWGHLTVRIDRHYIVSKQIGDSMDGVISWDAIEPYLVACGIDCSSVRHEND